MDFSEARPKFSPMRILAGADGLSGRTWRTGGRVAMGVLGDDNQVFTLLRTESDGDWICGDAVQPNQLHPPQHVVGEVGQTDPGSDPSQADIFQLRSAHAVFHAAED